MMDDFKKITKALEKDCFDEVFSITNLPKKKYENWHCRFVCTNNIIDVDFKGNRREVSFCLKKYDETSNNWVNVNKIEFGDDQWIYPFNNLRQTEKLILLGRLLENFEQVFKILDNYMKLYLEQKQQFKKTN